MENLIKKLKHNNTREAIRQHKLSHIQHASKSNIGGGYGQFPRSTKSKDIVSRYQYSPIITSKGRNIDLACPQSMRIRQQSSSNNLKLALWMRRNIRSYNVI